MKALAEGVYKGNKKSVSKDWINIDKNNNPKIGFHACIFLKKDDIVISFRGTDKNGKYNVS